MYTDRVRIGNKYFLCRDIGKRCGGLPSTPDAHREPVGQLHAHREPIGQLHAYREPIGQLHAHIPGFSNGNFCIYTVESKSTKFE